MQVIRSFGFDGVGLGDRQSVDMPHGLATSPSGGMQMIEGADAIRQAIMLLLTTTPGERVMRPDYGCPLQRLVFSPNDATTAGLAIHYVRKAVTRWERRIEIMRLDAGADPIDPAMLTVTLDYRTRATGEEQTLAFGVALDGDVS
jgi:phage baseplate assembly protein W